MEIIKGKIWTPPRVVVYGPEGIGKTTLASKLVKPLFIDLEGGSSRMNVDRVPTPKNWTELNLTIDNLTKDHGNYRCLVIDSADCMDDLCREYTCRQNKWNSIEETPYQKGWNIMLEHWKRFLDKLNNLANKTEMGICIIAHAKRNKVDLPDQLGSYDHYEMSLSNKRLAPAIKEWCDFLFFVHFVTDTLKVSGNGANAQLKAVGQYREICFQHTAWYDAKSRESVLNKPLKLDDNVVEMVNAALWQEIAPDMDAPADATPVVETAITPETPKAEETQEESGITPEPPPQLSSKQQELLSLVEKSHLTAKDIDMLVAKMGILPAGTAFTAYNDATCDRLITNWEKVLTNIRKLKGAK